VRQRGQTTGQSEVLPDSSLSRASEGTSNLRPILMVGISFLFAAS